MRNVRRVGDAALLVDCRDLAEVIALADAMVGAGLAGVREIVPAARTVLVVFDPLSTDRDALASHLASAPAPPRDTDAGPRVEIPVRYDGQDLAEVAGLLGTSEDEVIQRHTGTEWVAAFAGFAPGFAYLIPADLPACTGLPACTSLNVPRRSDPRPQVPAGAVGLAGEFSGVYPRASPGGWQLIGTALVDMWDLAREEPALVRPGARVRFVADTTTTPVAQQPDTPPSTSASSPTSATTAAPASPTPTDGVGALLVRQPGLRSLVQDAGRPGHAALGVSPSGALDGPALREVNRLLGNPADAAGVEVTLGGLELEARAEVTLAVGGARVPVQIRRASGRTIMVEDVRAVALSPGDVLAFGEPSAGLCSYLGVRGGVVADTALGSAATDTLSGLGPAPLAEGDLLRVGDAARAAVEAPRPWPALPEDIVDLEIVLGPQQDWFTAEALEAFLAATWTVSDRADRVGVRLTNGPELARARTEELPSEGMVSGAIQVPPSGEPVVFLADHPVTGGYPVIATVTTEALPTLAQRWPGSRVRFTTTVTPRRPHDGDNGRKP